MGYFNYWYTIYNVTLNLLGGLQITNLFGYTMHQLQHIDTVITESVLPTMAFHDQK